MLPVGGEVSSATPFIPTITVDGRPFVAGGGDESRDRVTRSV